MPQYDFYEVLDVPRDASTEQVKRQFRALAAKCHPDRFRGTPYLDYMTETFQVLSEAYETLKDPVKRKRYDRLHPTRSKKAAIRRFRDGLSAATLETAPATQPEPPPVEAKVELRPVTRPTSAVDEDLEVGTLTLSTGTARRLYEQGLEAYNEAAYDKAVAHFRKAVKLDPLEADYHSHLSLAILRTSRRSLIEAENEALEAIRLEPECADHHYHLALVYSDMGFLDAAQQAYRQVLLLEPTHKFALRWANDHPESRSGTSNTRLGSLLAHLMGRFSPGR